MLNLPFLLHVIDHSSAGGGTEGINLAFARSAEAWQMLPAVASIYSNAVLRPLSERDGQ